MHRVAGLVLLFATAASAQTGTVRGVVVDASGAPVRDADVTIPSLREMTKSGADGRFQFMQIRMGEIEISVRRLGFEPKVQKLVVSGFAVDSVRILLTARAVELASVNVTASEQRRRQGLVGFNERLKVGVGRFVTRAQIEQRVSGNASDMLRTMAGLRFVRTKGRGYGVRMASSSMRDGGSCQPMMWVDGQKAPGMEVDDIPLTDIEGIEVYSGPSTVPMQFSQHSTERTCGVIAIWSRPPPQARPKR
jgi:hypothetical protein